MGRIFLYGSALFDRRNERLVPRLCRDQRRLRDGEDPFPFLRRAFDLIAFAKVSMSGAEAQRMFLTPADSISPNPDRLIADAKQVALGLARAGNAAGAADPEVDAVLAVLQQRLFAVGADLATPPRARARAGLPPVEPSWVEEMERQIDGWEERLAPLRQFVLPGGEGVAAQLHLARTVCRRAERAGRCAVARRRRAVPDPHGPCPDCKRLRSFRVTGRRWYHHRSGRTGQRWL